MSVGYFLRIGDRSTCGGKILTGDSTFQWNGVSAAREGDTVSCGKHSGVYKILGGVNDGFDEGRLLAGSLDSFSSCPCRSRFTPSIIDSYFKETADNSGNNYTALSQSADEIINNLWISFNLPEFGNYNGLNYRLTMNDGSVHEGVIDENNKISPPSISASSCVSVEIEKPRESNNVSGSIAEQLLMNITG